MMRGEEEEGGEGGVCAPSDQTVGQRCLPACCDASQPLINIVTQYVKRPGFVPDATACVSVRLKVTHFIQQDGLTLGSGGVLRARLMNKHTGEVFLYSS